MHPDFMWAIYFAQIVGMNMHPGAGTKEHKKLTLEECADIADDMVAITKMRRDLCLSDSARSRS